MIYRGNHLSHSFVVKSLLNVFSFSEKTSSQSLHCCIDNSFGDCTA